MAAKNSIRETYFRHGFTNGKTRPAEYSVWLTMRDRCRNPRNQDFADYGGRGIKVCERWNDFAAFISDMGVRPSKKHQIDRRDNNGNYEPGNCRWATKKEQMRNTRRSRMLTLGDRTMSMSAWTEELGVGKNLISDRLRLGWSVEKALSEPCHSWIRPDCHQLPVPT